MKIICIYVSYNPDEKLLQESIESIIFQVNKVVVVNNSISHLRLLSDKSIDVIELNENIGIAAAQNVGMLAAIKEKYDFLILSDQDTIYPHNYIKEMLALFKNKYDVAAAVPTMIDLNRDVMDVVRFNVPCFMCKKKDSSLDSVVEVFEGASSGTLIRVETLNEIGLMNERLFIDWVDFEWCWRARSCGYTILGSKDVKIKHQLGGKGKKVFKKTVNKRDPIRHYYITRNAVFLSINSRSISILCRILLFIKALQYIIGYPLLFKPGLQHFKFVLLGFFDGIRGKLGKL